MENAHGPIRDDFILRWPSREKVAIGSDELKKSLVAHLVSSKLTGGEGGITLVARARRTSLTEFTGQDPYRLTMNVIIDRHSENRSVEAEITRLMAMTRVQKGAARPAIVKVLAAAIDPRVPRLEWLIESCDPTDGSEIRLDSGARSRQAYTITMIEYVEAVYVVVPKPVVGKRYRLHRVKKGDTFPKLAAKYYKKAGLWRIIAKYNKLTGPKIPAKYIGKNIKIPKRNT